MIDTHCHLTDPRLGQQLEAVLHRSRLAGVTGWITIGTSLADSRDTIALAHRTPGVAATVGIHPNYCGEARESDIDALATIEPDRAVVAIGECGLDYHYDRADRSRQRWFFEQQLALAKQRGRPVVVHCRDAVDDTLAILRTFPGVRCLFHCFTGSIEEARQIVDHGHWLGFTGAVTFKRNDDLRLAAAQCPAGRFVAETDAPYLAPEPHRSQKVNEPALVVLVADAIARARGVDRSEVDRLTTANTAAFFGRLP